MKFLGVKEGTPLKNFKWLCGHRVVQEHPDVALAIALEELRKAERQEESISVARGRIHERLLAKFPLSASKATG